MSSSFQPIDLTTWPRAQMYQHFKASPCCFDVTAQLDITAICGKLASSLHLP